MQKTTAAAGVSPEAPHEKFLESDLGAIRSLLATTTLREFLAARHVGRPEGVPSQRHVLVLTPSCTVGEALSKLVRRVQAAPGSGGRGVKRSSPPPRNASRGTLTLSPKP